MKQLHTDTVNTQLGTLRYSRAYTLSIEALHTLCCGRGKIRSRLEAVDGEYYTLRTTDLPDFGTIRVNFENMHSLATSVSPRWAHDGRLSVTLSTVHYTVLEKIAQLVWDIHSEFSDYMGSFAHSATEFNDIYN